MFYRKMKKQKRNPQKNLKVMKKMMRKLKLKKKKKKNPKQRRLNTERGTCASQLKKPYIIAGGEDHMGLGTDERNKTNLVEES